ncbi:MAG: TrkH family potassium uptake protein [Prevotellaceae bacterium]|nr:TrkH family potassium uptake protein [Prevotellaceae bacterium]
MINIKLVLHTIGSLLFFEAAFMLLAAAVSYIYGEPDFYSLLISFSVTLAVALLSYFSIKKDSLQQLEKREGYLIVTLIWVVFSLFGSLPFFLSGYIPEYTDAFFETMSGFSTTGATILSDIEVLPHGLLFWRSITQWLGGMGIIVLSLAVLPIFGIGGMQLYAAEVPGPTKGKLRPRVAQTAKLLWAIYASLTLIEVILLKIGGMDLFDAVCHSFTTMSTGGYSTKNASIAYWDSPFIEYVVIFFMLAAGMNYAVIYSALKGNFKKLYQDEEFRFYILFAFGFSFITMAVLLFSGNMGVESSARSATFQVVALMTGTGYTTVNYMSWIPFLWTLMCFIMLMGGCTGSSTGGIKTVRVALLLKNSYYEFKRILHPNAVIPVKFDQKVVPVQIINNILAFVVLYALIAIISILIFTLLGIGFIESVGTVVSCLSNVGPGLGAVGPMDDYSLFPDAAKWYASFLMLTGRLEIFTVLFMLMPSFWKR